MSTETTTHYLDGTRACPECNRRMTYERHLGQWGIPARWECHACGSVKTE